MRKKQKFIMLLIAISILIGLSGSVWANSEAESSNDLNNVIVQTNDSFMPFEITSKKHENYFLSKFNRFFERIGTALPSRYISENLTVKDQGTTGECWAFSFTSAFEAYNLKKEGKTDLYSPKHIDYSCSKSFSDVTDTQNLFNRETTENVGNSLMAVAYSASGKGPVLESDMPFDNDVETKISYSDLNKEAKKRIDTSVLFDSIYKKYENGDIKYYSDRDLTKEISVDDVAGIRRKVKEQIQENGGVIASIYQANLAHKDIFITQSGLKSNHSIFIVGWDDDYQATGWTTKGAYIALNSYGQGYFYDGYVYIAYDDACVEYSLMGVAKTSDIGFDNVYEYDPFGATASVYSGGLGDNGNDPTTDLSEISAINIFGRDNSKREILKEVGVSTFSYQKAEVYFSDTFDGENDLPINFRKVADLTDTLSPGFIVIPLKEEVILDKDRFAICVKFVEDNEEHVATAAIEYRVNTNKWWDNVIGVKGESYYVDKFNPSGSNTYWSLSYKIGDTGEVVYKNASIKAYTTNKQEEENPLIITSSDYRVLENEKSITRVPAQTDMSDFKSKVSINRNYSVTDKDGNVVTDGIMKTGYKIVVENEVYSISVIGDISSDGKLDILDLARIRLYLVGKNNYEGVYLHAADLNGNGKSDLIDLSIMRLECVKR